MKWRSCLLVGLALVGAGVLGIVASDDNALYLGGVRLELLQNNDGGWDWPLNDGNPGSTSPLNTIGPIAMGLARAEWNDTDPAFRAALADAGALLLTKSGNFSPSDGYLAVALDSVFGGTTYRDYVMANFYGPLAAGTYNRNGSGTLYSTAAYIQLIRMNRAGTGNLAEWDLGMGAVAAVACGGDPAAWVAGIKAELNEHNSNDYYDVIGLAGAIYGLAVAGADFDPTAGDLAAAANLRDLADILAGYQITTGAGAGGFAWNANYVIPNDNDECVQETAYAILALNALDRAAYLDVIQSAADWLIAFQLATGGWLNYVGDVPPDGGENNELTGEAMWGIHGVYLADVWVGPGGSDSGFGFGFLPFATVQRAIEAIEGLGGTVNVAHGVYLELLTLVAGSTNLFSEAGSASHTTLSGPIHIKAGDIVIGRAGQGFTVSGDVAIGAGVDASTVNINWNNLLGSVENGGTGVLDAEFNYWGTQDQAVVEGRTLGAVDFDPFLPLDADASYDGVLTLIESGVAGNAYEAVARLWEATSFYPGNLDAYIQSLTSGGGGDGSPWDGEVELQTQVTLGEAAGAGGGVEGGLGTSFAAGDPITGSLLLTDPETGAAVRDTIVTVTLIGTDADGDPVVAELAIATYDEATGEYTFEIATDGLAPGMYQLIFQTNAGQTVTMEVEVV